jgi:hypothetical protein
MDSVLRRFPARGDPGPFDPGPLDGHAAHCIVEARDHLARTESESQRLTAFRAVELGTVVEGTLVVNLDVVTSFGLTHIDLQKQERICRITLNNGKLPRRGNQTASSNVKEIRW